MRYPVSLRPYPEGFTVSFADIPEALTRGDDEADALRNAADALESAFDFYFETKRRVPLPSSPKRGKLFVELPPSLWAKVLLHNELLLQGIRPAELARRMAMPRQEMTRMLDPRHATKIDSIGKALASLGKRLEVSVS